MDAKRRNDNTSGLTTGVLGTGKGRGVLLLCLLMLVGGFSCDRSGPQPEQKSAEAEPPVTKLPLPQRGDQTAKPGPAAVNPDKNAPAPVAAAAPAPAPAAAALPAGEQPGKGEPKKAAAAPAGTKPLPAQVGAKAPKAVAAARPGPAKPSAPEKAPAEKKAAASDGDDKIAALMKKPAKKEKASQAGALKGRKQAAGIGNNKRPQAEKGAARGWTVVVGTYLLEDAMAPDLVKVRKAGLEAAVKPGTRVRSTMNRLFLAEYADAGTARAEMGKLMQQTSDAFILLHGGKHSVYAGSYLLGSRAASEKERLAAAGFPLTLKRVNVAITSKMLIAGSFDDRAAAEEAADKLKKAGLKATLVRR